MRRKQFGDGLGAYFLLGNGSNRGFAPKDPERTWDVSGADDRKRRREKESQGEQEQGKTIQ